MRIIYFLNLWLFVTLVFLRCANIGQPDGGARDMQPPVIDSSESTPNLKTNFHPDLDKTPIILKFEEWIKLEDAFKQVVISPPLLYTPKIGLKGKGVQVLLDPREVLKAQTTYTINFGTSIKDITESNPAKDLRFVFSTGDVIDTAFVAGRTIDALTGETKENLLVMLYEADEDTIVYKRRPTYFSRTDKDGKFIIRNIKDSTYKIFVLEDGNSNYLYDQDKEFIGFLNRRVQSGEDSLALILSYYKSFVRPRITNYATEAAGVIKLQSNVPLDELRVESLLDNIQLAPIPSNDTLMVFYTPITARDWNLKISFDDKPLDTILINKIRKNTLDSLKPIQSYRDVQSLGPGGLFLLEFNQPLTTPDTQYIKFYDDTTKTNMPLVLNRGKSSHQLIITCPCIEQHAYTLTVLPDALKNFNGNPLFDTVVIKFRGVIPDQSGILTLHISNLDSTLQYQVQLLQDKKVLEDLTVSEKTSWTKSFNFLQPSTYNIQVLEDRNRNGRWDPGDYLRKIQPEKIYTQKNYNVRANWELKEQINWKP